MKSRFFAASAATVALCLVSGEAVAQDQGGTAPETESETGEIIVTAQHRRENLQDVPISMTALGGEALADSNVTSIQDLDGAVPGLVVSKSVSYGLAPISIRGLGGPAGGGSLLTEQPVAVYVDGVYVPALGQSVSDFLDLDTVQVLRGPQGTLYGRNSTAGAILLTSKRPGDELALEARGSYGSFDEFKLSGAFNLPLIEDQLALRVALARNSGGDWAKNTVDGREFGGGSSTSGRVSVRFTPNSDLTIDLIGDHSTGRSRPATVQLSTATPIFAGPALGTVFAGNPFVRRTDYSSALNDRTVQIVGDQFTRSKATNVSLLVDWELGDLTLSSISGYRNFRVSGSQDASVFTTPATEIAGNSTLQKQESFSQEVRLASADAEPFKWTLGLYYFHQETDAFINITNLQAGPPVATGFGQFGPIFTGMPSGTSANFDAQQNLNAYAAFVDATYDISEQLSITGGLRYSRDEKSAAVANLVQTVTPTVLAGPILVNASCPSATVDCSKNFENISPRAVVNFKPTEDNLLYLSYSRGFNSGGFNNFGNVANPTDPTNPLENSSEKNETFEIGSKNEFLDRALRLNLSAFRTTYTDLHIRQAVFTGGVAIVNVPRARVTGFELDTAVEPVDGLVFSLNGAYLDSEIREGSLAAISSTVGNIIFGQNVTVGTVDVAGNRLTRAPKWQGSASVRYEYPTSFGSISASSAVKAQSKSFFLETNQDSAQFVGESWEEVDVRLAVSGPDNGWEIALSGSNIFDNRHISQIVPFNGFPIATLNSPRSWTVSGAFRF